MVRTSALARLAVFAAALVLALSSTALAYQYFFAEELEASLAKQVGKQVKVVDKLVKIWEQQEVEGYLRFDTHYFRCAIPASETEGIAWLRELMKKQEGTDKTPEAIPPLVAIYGTVQRPQFWGKPKEGKGEGVPEDQIMIVVDKVEKPRARFWEEGY
jgi:hypothetical protein